MSGGTRRVFASCRNRSLTSTCAETTSALSFLRTRLRAVCQGRIVTFPAEAELCLNERSPLPGSAMTRHFLVRESSNTGGCIDHGLWTDCDEADIRPVKIEDYE